MDAELATRVLDDDELDAAIESISALSVDTIHTNYTIDLSVLSRPPVQTVPETAMSPKSPKRRNRRLLRAPRECSPSLPSSPPPDAIVSDDIDGPEDFTMNMEYWMRCQMSDPINKDVTGSAEAEKPLDDSLADPIMAQNMDEWATRGSDRLKALVAERLATDHEPSRREPASVPDTLRTGEPTRKGLGDNLGTAGSSTALEGSAQGLPFPAPQAAPQRVLPGPANEDLVSTPRPESSATDTTRRHASVEDYFSSPVRQPRVSPLRRSPATVVQNGRNHGTNAKLDQIAVGQFAPSSQPLVHDHSLDRMAALEAEVRLLKMQLGQSRHQFQESRNDELPVLATQSTGLPEQGRTNDARLGDHDMQPLDSVSQEATVAPEQLPLYIETVSAGESDTVRDADAQSRATSLANASMMPLNSGSPASVGRVSGHPALSSPSTERTIAQILDGPLSPSASRLNHLVVSREKTINDLQQKLVLVSEEAQRLKSNFDVERARWIAETVEHREAFAMQQADSEARLSFLRDELAQRTTELTESKRQLTSAQQDAESAAERLRIRDAECAGEVRNLKAKLAASDATREEQRMKLTTLQAQNEEAQQMLRRTHQRNRDLERHVSSGNMGVSSSVGGDHPDHQHAIGVLGAQLEQERSTNVTLTREILELKDDLDLLREQLRLSSLDGAAENGRHDSGIGVDGSSLEQSTMSMQGELQNLREELRGQIHAATDARAEAKAAMDELERSRREVAHLKKALDASEEKSLEVERRVGELLRTRDEEIKRRIRELKGEKRQMGRALMRSWGERECGEEMPQKYRYAF